MRWANRLSGAVHGIAASALSAALCLTPALGRAQDAPPPVARPAPPPLGEGVAAIVNDEVISTYDLRQRIRLLIMTSGVQPTEQNFPQLEQEALRSLVEEHIQLQEVRRESKAQKVDIIASDQDVEQQIDVLAQDNRLTGAQLRTSLAAAGVDVDTLRQQVRAQISWQRWIQGRYGTRLRVPAAQVTAFLEHYAEAASKPRYQLAEILIDANRAGGMENAMRGAQQLIDQIQKGAPFVAVARQFSSAPTAANGGDAGWVQSNEVPPEVAATLDALRPGQLSAPVPVRDGVYILLLRDKQAASTATLVDLKQAAIRLTANAGPDQVAEATRTLQGLRGQIKGCADIESVSSKVPGVSAGDLGEAAVDDLAPAFRDAAMSLPQGQVSQPIRTAVGLHLIMVCSKRVGGATLPSRVEVENRLFSQRIALMSKRYLRDLRNAATIETR